MSEVRISHLPPDELDRYRALPKPEKPRVVTEWHGNGRHARPRLMVIDRGERRQRR